MTNVITSSALNKHRRGLSRCMRPTASMHCRDVAVALQQEGSWPLTAKRGAGAACGLNDKQLTTASDDSYQQAASNAAYSSHR
jgi:hypothetical protein